MIDKLLTSSRQVALDRKLSVRRVGLQWRSAERAAAIYNLITTANLNGVDPDAYLRMVLTRIADHHVNRASELPPWNMPAT